MRSRFTKHKSTRCYFLSSVVLCNICFIFFFVLSEWNCRVPALSLAQPALPVAQWQLAWCWSFSNIDHWCIHVLFAFHLPGNPHIGQSNMSSVYPVSANLCVATVIVGITSNWRWWLCIKLFQEMSWALVTVWQCTWSTVPQETMRSGCAKLSEWMKWYSQSLPTKVLLVYLKSIFVWKKQRGKNVVK